MQDISINVSNICHGLLPVHIEVFTNVPDQQSLHTYLRILYSLGCMDILQTSILSAFELSTIIHILSFGLHTVDLVP